MGRSEYLMVDYNNFIDLTCISRWGHLFLKIALLGHDRLGDPVDPQRKVDNPTKTYDNENLSSCPVHKTYPFLCLTC